MVAKILTGTTLGIQGIKIEVEVDLSPGIPQFNIVGLPDSTVRESKERVLSAIKNSGFSQLSKKVVVNLAPADIRKEGSLFDLPIAVGILKKLGYISSESQLQEIIILGELSLEGTTRKVQGVLPCILALKEQGFKKFIIPKENALEGGIVEDVEIYPVESLVETVEFLNGEKQIQPFKVDIDLVFKESQKYTGDFSDIKGQETVKRGLEVASAGGHNVLMIGPPGAGKTMMARLFPTILPSMTLEEALETTKIYSVAGLLPKDKGLVATRPFRAPHHTVTEVGMIGGGPNVRPGEVSLAHNGVLFLDELPEFPPKVLESLRQPMEDGFVTITRAKMSVKYPSKFQLIAAMNPCPCGYLTDPKHECTCTPGQIQKYHSKLSGPLLDRIDIHLEVPALSFQELISRGSSESSQKIRERVEKAREIQLNRFKDQKGIFSNSQMGSKEIKEYCKIDETSEQLIKLAMEKFGYSARAFDRILKVARTIADLEGSQNIKPQHVSEAIGYRSLDRKNFFL